MGDIDHAGNARSSGMRPPMSWGRENPDEVILDDDIDMVAHQSVRDA